MSNRLLSVLGGFVLFGLILLGLRWFGVEGDEPTKQDNDPVAEPTQEKPAKPAKRRPLDIALSTPKPAKQLEKKVMPVEEKMDEQEEPEVDPKTGEPKMQLGSMPIEAINGPIRDAMPEIRGCYQDALQEVPDLGGRISVKFTIVNDEGVGRIKKLSVKEAQFDDVPFEDCLLDVVETLEFDPPEGGAVIIRYPFIFASE